MTTLFVGPGGGDRDDVDRQLTDLPAPPVAVAPDPEVAEVDLRIERPDLGIGCHTFVAAGHEIPHGLADLPRHPVQPAPETPEDRQPATARRSRRGDP